MTLGQVPFASSCNWISFNQPSSLLSASQLIRYRFGADVVDVMHIRFPALSASWKARNTHRLSRHLERFCGTTEDDFLVCRESRMIPRFAVYILAMWKKRRRKEEPKNISNRNQTVVKLQRRRHVSSNGESFFLAKEVFLFRWHGAVKYPKQPPPAHPRSSSNKVQLFFLFPRATRWKDF